MQSIPHLDNNPQFFADFAPERIFPPLTMLNFSAWKLPLSAEMAARCTLTDKQLTLSVFNQRTDDIYHERILEKLLGRATSSCSRSQKSRQFPGGLNE